MPRLSLTGAESNSSIGPAIAPTVSTEGGHSGDGSGGKKSSRKLSMSGLLSRMSSSPSRPGGEISGPMMVQHVTHVGWSASKGFEVSNLPPEWVAIFKAAGVRKRDLVDPVSARLIIGILAENMMEGRLEGMPALPGLPTPPPAANAGASAAAASPPPPDAADALPSDDVQQLVGMGFGREEVEGALARAGGDMEVALEALLGGGGGSEGHGGGGDSEAAALADDADAEAAAPRAAPSAADGSFELTFHVAKLGLRLSDDDGDDGHTSVVYLAPGGPGERRGVLVGDRLLAVNGDDVVGFGHGAIQTMMATAPRPIVVRFQRRTSADERPTTLSRAPSLERAPSLGERLVAGVSDGASYVASMLSPRTNGDRDGDSARSHDSTATVDEGAEEAADGPQASPAQPPPAQPPPAPQATPAPLAPPAPPAAAVVAPPLPPPQTPGAGAQPAIPPAPPPPPTGAAAPPPPPPLPPPMAAPPPPPVPPPLPPPTPPPPVYVSHASSSGVQSSNGGDDPRAATMAAIASGSVKLRSSASSLARSPPPAGGGGATDARASLMAAISSGDFKLRKVSQHGGARGGGAPAQTEAAGGGDDIVSQLARAMASRRKSIKRGTANSDNESDSDDDDEW